MHVDLAAILQRDANKLPVSTAVPRPNALATPGRGWYARTSDLFPMHRMSYGGWKDKQA